MTDELRAAMIAASEEIPFIQERDFIAFLRREEKGGGKVIRNEWDVLALLCARRNDPAQRAIVMSSGRNKKYFACIPNGTGTDYPIPVPETVRIVDDLLVREYVDAVMVGLVRDYSQLSLTKRGLDALVAHSNQQLDAKV